MDNLIQDFIDEECIEDSETVTRARDIYQRFVEWYEENFSSCYPNGEVIRQCLMNRYARVMVGAIIHYKGVGFRERS